MSRSKRSSTRSESRRLGFTPSRPELAGRDGSRRGPVASRLVRRPAGLPAAKLGDPSQGRGEPWSPLYQASSSDCRRTMWRRSNRCSAVSSSTGTPSSGWRPSCGRKTSTPSPTVSSIARFSISTTGASRLTSSRSPTSCSDAGTTIRRAVSPIFPASSMPFPPRSTSSTTRASSSAPRRCAVSSTPAPRSSTSASARGSTPRTRSTPPSAPFSPSRSGGRPKTSSPWARCSTASSTRSTTCSSTAAKSSAWRPGSRISTSSPAGCSART